MGPMPCGITLRTSSVKPTNAGIWSLS